MLPTNHPPSHIVSRSPWMNAVPCTCNKTRLTWPYSRPFNNCEWSNTRQWPPENASPNHLLSAGATKESLLLHLWFWQAKRRSVPPPLMLIHERMQPHLVHCTGSGWPQGHIWSWTHTYQDPAHFSVVQLMWTTSVCWQMLDIDGKNWGKKSSSSNSSTKTYKP
jgi:hypothetical protein